MKKVAIIFPQLQKKYRENDNNLDKTFTKN